MLEVRLLGHFEVYLDGKPLAIPTRNAQLLLAFLVLNAGKAHRRERLAGLLWPDSSEENARGNLRHELWRLRKAINTHQPAYFLIDDLTITFDPRQEFTLDVHKLESTPLDGPTLAGRPADELIAVLSVYQGELLPGFYEEWVLTERARLSALFETRIARLLEILQKEGRWEDVLDWGLRWTAMGHWPEPAYRALMSAYTAMGNGSKAARTYESFSKGVQKDLGIKPSEQTQALYKRLKSGRGLEFPLTAPVSAQPSGSPPPTSTLKKTAPAFPLPRLRHSNLPRPLTSFIGREKELQQLAELACRARLVTITGPGGVGKTRMAIQVGAALASQFQDGVWWVELAALSRPSAPKVSDTGNLDQLPDDLVPLAIARILRIPEEPGLPILEGLLAALREKQLLLVLDNCEHLIADCAAIAERLLGECPDVSILATSREALGVPGEKTWLLPSLSLPEIGVAADLPRLLQSEAVSLFIERAGDVHPAYQPGQAEALTIAQICMRLDGIPLAIELAAARKSVLSTQEIAARLDRRFSLLTSSRRTALPRHQTLHAAIEWSFELLSQPEQVLFHRLSVFAGSFSLEAAEAICTSPEIAGDEVLGLLGRLVDKSLLRVEISPPDSSLATRYRFLDTIHSYGRLKLQEAHETSWMSNRHAAYYVGLVEAAEPELLLQTQVRWFKLLQAEKENLRAVIEYSALSDQAENALRVVVALTWFWFSNGPNREGLDLAIQALSIPSAVHFKDLRARALNSAGLMQIYGGEIASARRSLEEAQSVLRELDNQANLAWSLQCLGLVLAFDGKYDQADAAFQEGLAIARKLGGKHVNTFLHFLGDIELHRGDRIRAQETYLESVNILRWMGSKSFLGYPLRRLGYLALAHNNILQAKEYFQESLALNLEVSDQRAITGCLISSAALALHLDKPEVAARLCGMVEKRQDLLTTHLHYTDQAEYGLVRNKLYAALDEAAFMAAYSAGWDLTLEQGINFAEQVFADLP